MGLVVKSEVGDFFKKKGMRTSGSVFEALDRQVAAMLGEAAARAKANGRQTVMAQDC